MTSLCKSRKYLNHLDMSNNRVLQKADHNQRQRGFMSTRLSRRGRTTGGGRVHWSSKGQTVCIQVSSESSSGEAAGVSNESSGWWVRLLSGGLTDELELEEAADGEGEWAEAERVPTGAAGADRHAAPARACCWAVVDSGGVLWACFCTNFCG